MASVRYETQKFEKLLDEVNDKHAAYIRVPGTYASEKFFELKFTLEFAKEEECSCVDLNSEDIRFLEDFSGQG